MKNQMDLAVNIAIGSSIQVALFVAPVLVFASYLFGRPMDLVFSTFEVVAVTIAAGRGAPWSRMDGESNWMEGRSFSASTSSWAWPSISCRKRARRGGLESRVRCPRPASTRVGGRGEVDVDDSSDRPSHGRRGRLDDRGHRHPVRAVRLRSRRAARRPGLAQVPPVEFGAAFPAAKFANLNDAPGQPATVDLATYLGKKPIVFVYWMAGNPRSEKILLDTQAAVDKAGADKVAFFSVAAPAYGSTDVAPIKARTAALKVKAPVLQRRGLPAPSAARRSTRSRTSRSSTPKGSCGCPTAAA